MKNKIASESTNPKGGGKKEKEESPFSVNNQKQATINRILRIIEETIILRVIWIMFFWTTIIFIVLTYFSHIEPPWLVIINLIVLLIFLVDFFIRLYISTHRLFFLTSSETLRDLFIILPLFLIDTW